MTLTAGTCLGAYEITAQIGAGGMGEVYRAKDTKLGRDVALKVLPASFTHDAHRVSGQRSVRDGGFLSIFSIYGSHDDATRGLQA